MHLYGARGGLRTQGLVSCKSPWNQGCFFKLAQLHCCAVPGQGPLELRDAAHPSLLPAQPSVGRSARRPPPGPSPLQGQAPEAKPVAQGSPTPVAPTLAAHPLSHPKNLFHDLVLRKMCFPTWKGLDKVVLKFSPEVANGELNVASTVI